MIVVALPLCPRITLQKEKPCNSSDIVLLFRLLPRAARLLAHVDQVGLDAAADRAQGPVALAMLDEKVAI